MSEPTRGEKTRKEIRRLKFLVKDLEKTIGRLEDLIESSDEESVDELQTNGIKEGTIVIIDREIRESKLPNKYAVVLALTSATHSLVQTQLSSKAVNIANAKLQVATTGKARRFHGAWN